MIYILMGVSGSGKTTVGTLLSDRTGIPFYDADEYHPVANLRKMSAGVPLTDADRQPWLENLANALRHWQIAGDAILACSALREHYRQQLEASGADIQWIWLKADRDIIASRLSTRDDHFFPPELLDSQFSTLEAPSYGWHFDTRQEAKDIVAAIVRRVSEVNITSLVGFAGLGVMGSSLVINLAGKGISVAAYNRFLQGTEEGVAQNLVKTKRLEGYVRPFQDLHAFVKSIALPRKIFLMVQAGKAVDDLLEEMLPHLAAGDIIVDCGNSHYKDTMRRAQKLMGHGVTLVGCGVSGGAEGALKGPSIMPGGPVGAVKSVMPVLQKIAARDRDGTPCVTYVGPGGSGHFVKMVHNGIEYGEMQIIADIYGLLRFGMSLTPQDIADIFESWQDGRSESFLLQTSIEVLRKNENGSPVIDLIRDTASHKGTGKWTVEAALDLGIACPVIYAALSTRQLSSDRALRHDIARALPSGHTSVRFKLTVLENAMFAARLINHASGFDILRQASDEYAWSLDLAELARIWTNGCIIRSGLMVELSGTLRTCAKHLLLCPGIRSQLEGSLSMLREVVAAATSSGMPVPALSSALTYMDIVRSKILSTHLIQGQRDFFGTHGFQRTDTEDDELYHL